MGLFLFNHFSISNKLVGIVTLSWLLIAGLITTFFVGQDFYSFRSERVADLAGLARVLSINCTAPLEFADADTAAEVLSSLSARPLIHQAGVYTKDQQLFALYVSPSGQADEQMFPEQFPYDIEEEGDESFFFNNRNLELYVPVVIDGELLGTLLLREDLSDFTDMLWRTGYVVGTIMAASLFFAWIVSLMLQRYISNPILAMAESMRRVRNEKQYSIRIKNEYSDELSVLADGFNSMLDQVQKRDKQLLDAKQTAEEANRAKSTFLAQMSHEIRTPMNGVLGIASLLLGTSLSERQMQFVHTISRSGEALLNVINDILDFSKIEAGKLELEEITFTLHSIAEEAIDLLSEHVSEKGLQMVCQIDPRVPKYLKGDPGRLRQVLMNLLGNGVKFTSEGHVNLTIQLENRSQDQVSLLFEVTDSGIGIQNENLKRIFTAFAQADDTTTRRFGGTGLGLVISSQLVKLQGGKIGVESEERQGSTFWFTAVYKIANASDLTLAEIPLYGGAWSARNLEQGDFQQFQAHILVAEDNLTNQIVTRGLLEKLGCTVDIAEHGLEAVEAAQNNSYDLIFMDCHMPQMDGYEASAIIRQNSAQDGEKHIAIIALTAYAMKGDREQCLAAGMDDYLSKPCTESQVEAVLRKWLSGESINKGKGTTFSESVSDDNHDIEPLEQAKIEEERAGQAQGEHSKNEDEEHLATIDQNVLNSLRDLQIEGRPDILETIINAYLKSSVVLVGDLHKGLASEDTEGVQNAAHSLKSSSANVGAVRLSEIAKELEMNCRNSMLENVENLVEAIETEFIRVKDGLNREIFST